MLSPDCQSLPATTLSLDVLMVGFHEAEISPSCRAALTSLEPNPLVEWVTTVQKGITQIESGYRYDVIVLDCRKEEGEWGGSLSDATGREGSHDHWDHKHSRDGRWTGKDR